MDVPFSSSGYQIKALNTATRALCADSAIATRIESIPDFGEASSAELAGEISTVEQFENEASFALYSGMVNLEHSSGNYKGAKSARQVNKRAKAAMMVAVVRHMACVLQSRAYYDKKRAEDKTHNQPVRALVHHAIRIIWSVLKHDWDYQLRSELQQAA